MKRSRVLLCLLASMLSVGGILIEWDSAFRLLSQIPVIGLIIGYNFQPLHYVDSRIDVPLCVESTNVQFSCKYKGRYEIDIVGCEVSPWSQSMLGLRMSVMDMEGTVLYHAVRSNEVALLSFDERGEMYMRFCYAVLDIPNDLPVETPLLFSFSCFGNYEAFRQLNPYARVILRKFIDK